MELGDPCGDLVGAVGCRRAERGEHEQAGFGTSLHDMLEQGERRQLGPVQVVEDQRQRSLLAQHPEQPGHGVEQVAADLARLGATLLVGRADDGPPPVTTAEARDRPARPGGELPRLGGGEQVIEHLGEGLVGKPGVGARGADQHRHVVVV